MATVEKDKRKPVPKSIANEKIKRTLVRLAEMEDLVKGSSPEDEESEGPPKIYVRPHNGQRYIKMEERLRRTSFKNQLRKLAKHYG